MIRFDLREFLRTGRLGPLHLGLHQGQLFDVLPIPASTVVVEQETTRMAWGCVELLLSKGVVDAIGVCFEDPFPVVVSSARIATDDVSWPQLSIDEVVELLTRWGGFLVPREPSQWLTRLHQRRSYPMTVSPHVKLLFERRGDVLKPDFAICVGGLL